jgi:acetoin utilization deacetylase AcuC-like enzyme
VGPHVPRARRPGLGTLAAVLLVARPPAAAEHDTGPGHPERAPRLAAAWDGLVAAGLRDAIVVLPTREATDAELARVHPADHLAALAAACERGGRLDPDTVVVPESWTAARQAAGAGLAAVDALDAGEGTAALLLVRPPGHHAEPDRAMGFCLLNTIAVTAAALADRGERVLVVDWDVHHGNGTQAAFWDDPRVLYVSLHQSPLYPGTGRAGETGGPAAPLTNCNVPTPPGTTGASWRAALDDVVAPVVDRFDPTWVLVSAGFDAHRDDPLAGHALAAGDYADLARRVAGFAPGPGRLVLALEGGYDLDALGRSVGAAAAAVLDVEHRPEPATAGGPGDAVVAALAARWRELLAG